MKTPIEQLEYCVKVQCAEGNYNYDEYMLGFANGLILAEAIIKNQEPVYMNRPDKFLCETSLSAPINPSNPL